MGIPNPKAHLACEPFQHSISRSLESKSSSSIDLQLKTERIRLVLFEYKLNKIVIIPIPIHLLKIIFCQKINLAKKNKPKAIEIKIKGKN